VGAVGVDPASGPVGAAQAQSVGAARRFRRA
jgi:hypothetical protein